MDSTSCDGWFGLHIFLKDIDLPCKSLFIFSIDLLCKLLVGQVANQLLYDDHVVEFFLKDLLSIQMHSNDIY